MVYRGSTFISIALLILVKANVRDFERRDDERHHSEEAQKSRAANFVRQMPVEEEGQGRVC